MFLGDFVDRGPASRQVLELLIERARAHSVQRAKNRQTIFLKGNHETLLVNFVAKPSTLGSWQRLRGIETLVSYGITPSMNADIGTQGRLAIAFARALPPSHKRFLDDLPLSYTCGDYFFVHAGIRPGVAL